MDRKFENKLENGLAYLEFVACYTKDKKTGEALRSKNGNLMMAIDWSVVDRFGNCGRIYDNIVITEKARFKIDNLENVLDFPKVNGIFDYDNERFNLALFGTWISCGASIENDEYGPKIKRYVPLAFYKAIEGTVTKKEPDFPNSSQAELVGNKDTNSANADDLEYDDLPF